MFIKEYGKLKARVLRPLGLEPLRIMDPDKNGEYAFLRHISRLPEIAHHDCVVDVGAHIGDYTFKAMESFENTKDLFDAAIYSYGINYLGLPAGVVPIGLVDGLPAGIQIVGRRFREDLILDAMMLVEGHVGVMAKTLWARS